MAPPKSRRARKVLLLAVKLALLAAALTWVLSRVHWNDYVVAKADGKSYAVAAVEGGWDAPRSLTISRGALWWRVLEPNRPVSDFLPIEGENTIRRQGLRRTLLGASPALLAAALAGYVLSLAVIAVRWWLLLGIQQIRIGLWETQRLTFLGQFFNVVVPGTVGGDLVKAYYVARHTPRKAAALVSIFVDRITGFAELALLAGVMLLVVWGSGLAGFQQIRRAGAFVVLFLAGISAALVFLLSPAVRRALHLQKLYQRLPIAHHIAAAGQAADLYRRRLGTLAQALLITVGAQVAWICSIGLLGLALGLPLPFYSYLVYVPVIYMCAAFIPIPGGLGAVEGAYVLFFSSPTVTASQILALALLARLCDIARGLPGGVVALTGPPRPKAQAMQAELGIGSPPGE